MKRNRLRSTRLACELTRKQLFIQLFTYALFMRIALRTRNPCRIQSDHEDIMEKQQLINTVQSILKTKKELVGIRTWQQAPKHIPRYSGNANWLLKHSSRTETLRTHVQKRYKIASQAAEGVMFFMRGVFVDKCHEADNALFQCCSLSAGPSQV